MKLIVTLRIDNKNILDELRKATLKDDFTKKTYLINEFVVIEDLLTF